MVGRGTFGRGTGQGMISGPTSDTDYLPHRV